VKVQHKNEKIQFLQKKRISFTTRMKLQQGYFLGIDWLENS
jgi:hypothetical protein